MSIELNLGDCLEVMGRIPAGSVDAIICDLPYSVTACAWDVLIPFEPLWEHYRRVIKPNGAVVLFGSQPFTSAIVMSNPRWFRDEWIWEKDRATRFLEANRRPLKAHESVLVFGASAPRYYPQKTSGHPLGNRHGVRHSDNLSRALRGRMAHDHGGEPTTERFPRSVVRFNVPNGTERGLHPTQKPVALLEYLIRTYTSPGETVMDNCMGSGTAGVACVNTGRSFIGIERDETYFNVGRQRIADAQAQRALLPAP